MKLREISVESVLSGKNWTLDPEGDGIENRPVMEADQFQSTDQGLFSALVQFADKSIHPGLVVKAFAQGGDELDLYVHTKFGWMNLQEQGFMRAAGKYSHELFPFDYFVANPWKGGLSPEPDTDSPHRKAFQKLTAQVDATSANLG